jgi:capsule polysaccharide export protein KpsE/RkpR
MLKSRTVSDAIIKRFDLQKRYDQDLLVDARRALEKRRDVSATRDGVITIEVEDRDPVRAADMANGFVEELERLTLTLAVSEASQRRLFFEKQLAQSKEDLAKAEVELKSFLQKSKLVTPEGQAQLTVAAAASLRAQITAREVQLAAMRAFATEQNPELARVQKEVAGLKTQLARMEKEAYGGQGDVLVSLGQAPETAVEYLQRVREVKYRAIQPERRSFPKRTLIVAVTAALAFLLAVIAAYLLEYFARSKNDPVVGQQIEDFLRHLRERR